MNFVLLPFRPGCALTALAGTIQLSAGLLVVNWELRGMIDRICWPLPLNPAGRTFGLWEHTCVEVFLGELDAPAYYEINLSPAGDWNTFSFADVRAGMAETPLLCLVDTHRQQATGVVTLSASFSVSANLTTPLRIGLSAVIEDTAGSLHYFALAHAERPDFHRRDNRILLLERE